MTKPALINKKPRKQHTPEFRQEALKLADLIGAAAATRELSLMSHSFMPGAANRSNK